MKYAEKRKTSPECRSHAGTVVVSVVVGVGCAGEGSRLASVVEGLV